MGVSDMAGPFFTVVLPIEGSRSTQGRVLLNEIVLGCTGRCTEAHIMEICKIDNG